MMNDHLLKSMDSVLNNQNIADLTKAAESIRILYGTIQEWGKEAKYLTIYGTGEVNLAAANTPMISERIYKIYRVVSIAPLNFFLSALSQDNLVAIRASAKGVMALKTQNYDCSEIQLLINAGIQMRHKYSLLNLEVSTDPRIKQALQFWTAGCPSITALERDYSVPTQSRCLA